MKKKRLIILLSFLIPIFILTGLALWIVTTDHVITPAYDENHTLAQYFAEETSVVYNGESQNPDVKDGIYSSDEEKENFFNTIEFYYKEYGKVGKYEKGVPTDAGNYSVKILSVLDSDNSTDTNNTVNDEKVEQEGALYVKFNINKANIVPTSTLTVNYDQEGNNGYFTTDKSLSSVTLNGTYVHSSISSLQVGEGKYTYTQDKLTVGNNTTYNFTFTPNNKNYNAYSSTIGITTYATVKYLNYDSSLINVIEVPSGSILTKPSDPSRTGYTFANWKYDTNVWNFSDYVYSDLNLKASYNVNTYTITYLDDDGSVLSTTNPTSYTIEDTITLIDPVNSNLTFFGWTSNTLLTPTKGYTISKSTGDLTFTANWKCKVIFLQDDDSIIKEILVDKGANVEAPALGTVTSDYEYTRKLMWKDQTTNEVITLSENKYVKNVQSNMNIIKFVQAVKRKYTIKIYYKDKDNEVSSVKTNASDDLNFNKSVFNFTSEVGTIETKDVEYGSDVSLKKRIRLSKSYTYYYTSGTSIASNTRYINCFYMSGEDKFDWNWLTLNNSDDILLNINGSTITVVVLCVQPQAIVTNGTAVSNENNYNANESEDKYGVWYEKMNDAFAACVNTKTTKHLRVYGQSQYNGETLNGHCLESDKTINSYPIEVNSINFTVPTYIKSFNDYTLNTYTDVSNKKFVINSYLSVILPYGTEDDSTKGYLTELTAAPVVSIDKMHSTMTIPAGMTVVVEGNLIVGGALGNGSTQYSFATLMNRGTIEVGNKKSITSFGYLKGSGDGIIYAKSGSTINDVFRMYDWPGGKNAVGIHSKNAGIFPLTTYSVHNISCKIRIYDGAYFKGWNQLNMNDSWANKSYITLVGTGGLFELTDSDNSGYIDRYIEETTNTTYLNSIYSASNQDSSHREIYDMYGSFCDNSISVKAEVIGTSTTITTGPDLPLPIGMMKVSIKKGTGILKANSYKLLPGSIVEVNQNTSLIIEEEISVSIIDDFNESYTYKQDDVEFAPENNPYSYYYYHKGWYSNYKGKETFGCQFIVNGTLNSKGNLGGIIKTSSVDSVVVLNSESSSYNYINSLTYSKWSLSSSCGVANTTLQAQMYVYDGLTISDTPNNVSTGIYTSYTVNSKYGFMKAPNAYTYTIKFDTNGGDKIDDVIIYTLDESGKLLITIDILPEPIKDYYQFVKWTREDGSDAINSYITADTTNKSGTITLTAQYNEIIYNLSFNSLFEDGSTGNNVNYGNSTTSFSIDDQITLVAASCDGYSFYGWYADSSCEEQLNIGTGNISFDNFMKYIDNPENANITLYGKFSKVTYFTVTIIDEKNQDILSATSYSIKEGSSISEDGYTLEVDDGTPNNDAEYEFYIIGFKDSSGNKYTIEEINNYKVSSSITFYIDWGSKTRVTIKKGSGSDTPSGTLTVDGNNYEFAGTEISYYFIPGLKATWTNGENVDKVSVSGATMANNSFTIGTSEITITVNASCIVSGTLITLADGSKKPVDEITYEDEILVFNHETGKWDVSRMLFITHEDEGFKEYETITLNFSNNYSITIVAEHGFYDMDLMRYVFINKNNIDSFIGHKFYSAELVNNELDIDYIELLSYEIKTEYTKIYCPVTAYHMNSFNNGLLAMPNFPYGAEGLVNIFEYDDDLKFNEEKMKADIEKYGIFEYEYFKDYFSYEAYLASPAIYLKVSIGKGYLTHEQMMLVIEYLLTGDLIE